MSKLRILFDGLYRLVGIARWAGDLRTENSVEAAWLLLPVLIAKRSDVFSEPSIAHFWHAIADGRVEQTATSSEFWKDAEDIFSNIRTRDKRARRIFRTLRPQSPPDVFTPPVGTSTPPVSTSTPRTGTFTTAPRVSSELQVAGLKGSGDVEGFLAKASQRFKRRETILRSISETDVHTLVLLGDEASPAGLTADQLAIFDSAVLERYRTSQRVTRGNWEEIRTVAQRAVGPQLSWTYSRAVSPHIRIKGFSLLGRLKLRDLDFNQDGSAIAIHHRETAVDITCETKELTARLTAHLKGGIIRGSAILRPAVGDDSYEQAVAAALSMIEQRVLSAAERPFSED